MRMIHDSELSFLASEQCFVVQILIVGQTRGEVLLAMLQNFPLK